MNTPDTDEDAGEGGQPSAAQVAARVQASATQRQSATTQARSHESAHCIIGTASS
jgi:hypothetical protein